MKRTITFICTALIFLLAACASQHHDKPFNWDENVENPFYGETLTVFGMDEAGLRRFARLFMAKNPGVRVEILDTGINPRDFDWDFTEISRRLRVQLLAGQAPTLMSTHFTGPHRDGFFADLMPLMEAHPRFNDDEWFMDIFYALSENGQLFYFPCTFGFRYIAANVNVVGLGEFLADKTTITASQMMEIYKKFGSLESGFYMTSFGTLGAQNIWLTPEFINLAEGHINFASDGFIKLLTETSQFIKPTPLHMQDFMRDEERQQLMFRYFMFHVVFSSSILHELGIGGQDAMFMNPLPFVNESGELYVYGTPTWKISAGASQVEKALALEFIRFMQDTTNPQVADIHERVVFLNSIGPKPINRDHFERRMYIQLNRSEHSAAFDPRLRYVTRDEIEYVINHTRSIMNLPMTGRRALPQSLRVAFSEMYQELVLGLISPHEAANRLQNVAVLVVLEGN